MFRHPNLKHSNGTFDDLSFEKKVDQSIRYFKVPAVKEKEGALNMVLQKIEISQKATKTINKVRRLYISVGSVAAAACVLAFVWLYVFSVETYQGSMQQTANVVYLPDNSRVVLAEGSQLKFSKRFFQRSVQLKGEAYFEVEKGSDFYVKTREGGVLVIGTRFSVNDLNEALKVHCYEGIVGVDYNKEKVRITAGVQFNGIDNSVDVEDTADKGYPKYAILNYSSDRVALNDLLPIIENYFGVDIETSGLLEGYFGGSVVAGNVVDAVDIICTSMMTCSYQVIDDNKILISTK